MEILRVEDLSFTYDRETFVLRDINVSFESGVCYGIFGKSGAGKSTLLSLLAGLDVSKYGHIYYKDRDLFQMNLDQYRCNEIGIIFQSYNLLPQLTAIENVILSMDISNLRVKDREKKAKALLKKVGLNEEKMNRRILQLSGGEQQRVAIARALSYDSEVILADEPTGNLDPEMESEIINLLINLAHKDKKCVIIISHSLNIKNSVDKSLSLANGKLICDRV
ncbi:MAG: ABC transporter ATP-binding protein [Bacilli bacterium]|nr:ABC transporter ATP-binding protein [Bacilli bacterium]